MKAFVNRREPDHHIVLILVLLDNQHDQIVCMPHTCTPHVVSPYTYIRSLLKDKKYRNMLFIKYVHKTIWFS